MYSTIKNLGAPGIEASSMPLLVDLWLVLLLLLAKVEERHLLVNTYSRKNKCQEKSELSKRNSLGCQSHTINTTYRIFFLRLTVIKNKTRRMDCILETIQHFNPNKFIRSLVTISMSSEQICLKIQMHCLILRV